MIHYHFIDFGAIAMIKDTGFTYFDLINPSNPINQQIALGFHNDFALRNTRIDAGQQDNLSLNNNTGLFKARVSFQWFISARWLQTGLNKIFFFKSDVESYNRKTYGASFIIRRSMHAVLSLPLSLLDVVTNFIIFPRYSLRAYLNINMPNNIERAKAVETYLEIAMARQIDQLERQLEQQRLEQQRLEQQREAQQQRLEQQRLEQQRLEQQNRATAASVTYLRNPQRPTVDVQAQALILKIFQGFKSYNPRYEMSRLTPSEISYIKNHEFLKDYVKTIQDGYSEKGQNFSWDIEILCLKNYNDKSFRANIEALCPMAYSTIDKELLEKEIEVLKQVTTKIYDADSVGNSLHMKFHYDIKEEELLLRLLNSLSLSFEVTQFSWNCRQAESVLTSDKIIFKGISKEALSNTINQYIELINKRYNDKYQKNQQPSPSTSQGNIRYMF